MLSLKSKIRRIKFWWRLAKAYFHKYKLRATTLVILFIIFLFAVSKLFPFISQKNILNIGVVGAYTIESIPSEVLALATQPLVSIDKNGKPQPALAQNWTVSDDNKTYVVFLKDNIKWHDGTDLDARQLSIAISNVKITYLNNKALKFDLENPLSSFLTILDKPVFKTNSFYGTGPERIVSIDKTDKIVQKISLVPNDNQLPRVNLKFYPTESQAINAFKLGEVKILNVPTSENFEKWPNISINKTLDENEIITIFYNNNDGELLSKDLRQALTYAINRDDFDGLLATGPISQRNWAYNESIRRYEYNPAKAKELIAKAEIKNPKITLSFAPPFKKVAESIQRDWEAIGVSTTLKEEQQLPSNFQAYLTTNRLPSDPDQYALWHSTRAGKGNITNYKNVKIDKLLEDGRSTNDEAKRKEAYFDFQKFLVEDTPAAFLYYPYNYQLIYKNTEALYKKLPS